MSSRDPNDLHPDLQVIFTRFMHQAKVAAIDVLCTCTYRSNIEQDALYAQGRTKPGDIVTNAKAGQSAHNYLLKGKPAAKAFDIVPLRNGSCVWGTKQKDDSALWQTLGKIGTDLGLNWYGNPKAPFHEMAHFQLKE